MKIRSRTLALGLSLCVLLGGLGGLSASGQSSVQPGPVLPAQEEADDGRFFQEPSQLLPEPTPAEQAQTTSPYGSVKRIDQPTALVSVYLDDTSGAHWTEEEVAQSQQKLQMAVEWIRQECLSYGVETQITYSVEDGDLLLYGEYQGSFVGGRGAYEGNDFYDSADAFCAEVDTEAFRQRYGDSVGFVFFFPVAGVDHTMVHYRQDGDNYYHEYSCLYEYDASAGRGQIENAPAAYAHELLHLFGAQDLYPEAIEAPVDAALVDYVAETWPDEIMYDTYSPDGSISYDAILQHISPVTAFFLGMTEQFEGMERFPLLQTAEPGIFTEQEAIAYGDPPPAQDAGEEFPPRGGVAV